MSSSLSRDIFGPSMYIPGGANVSAYTPPNPASYVPPTPGTTPPLFAPGTGSTYVPPKPSTTPPLFSPGTASTYVPPKPGTTPPLFSPGTASTYVPPTPGTASTYVPPKPGTVSTYVPPKPSTTPPLFAPSTTPPLLSTSLTPSRYTPPPSLSSTPYKPSFNPQTTNISLTQNISPTSLSPNVFGISNYTPSTASMPIVNKYAEQSTTSTPTKRLQYATTMPVQQVIKEPVEVTVVPGSDIIGEGIPISKLYDEFKMLMATQSRHNTTPIIQDPVMPSRIINVLPGAISYPPFSLQIQSGAVSAPQLGVPIVGASGKVPKSDTKKRNIERFDEARVYGGVKGSKEGSYDKDELLYFLNMAGIHTNKSLLIGQLRDLVWVKANRDMINLVMSKRYGL